MLEYRHNKAFAAERKKPRPLKSDVGVNKKYKNLGKMGFLV